MADNSSRRNEHRRSRSRKATSQPERQAIRQPEPDAAPSYMHTEYSFDQPYPQHDLSSYTNIARNVPMQDYFPDLGDGFNVGLEGSVKDYSATTTGSLLSNGTPSVVTENGSGSLVFVHHHKKRTYSDHSNQTSRGSSDGRNFSTPDDAEWNQAAAPAPIVETLEGDAPQAPHDHDPKYILSNMYSNTPRTVFNPYQEYVVSGGSEPSYSNSTNYGFQSGTSSNGIPSFANHAPVRSGLSDPWSPVFHQMSGYKSGDVAFAASPGPAVRQGPGEGNMASPGASSASGSARSGKSRDTTPCPKRPLASRGKGKAKALGWEHTTIGKGGLERIIENSEAPCHRTGIRTSGLDPEAAEKARRIRELKACWNCWIQKTSCSEGEKCEKCKKQFSPSADQLCSRAGFKDYLDIFFPVFLHIHLLQCDIEAFISKHTSHFTDTYLDVEVSVGEVFSPMVLRINIFQPRTPELLHHSRFATDHNHNLQVIDAYSVPVGILGLQKQEMMDLCNRYLDNMISNSKYPAQATAGDTSQLPRLILENVLRYRASKDASASLLRNALKLHAIHYFMKSLVTFSDDSAIDIYTALFRPDIPQPYLSSRLLNRQIKYIIHLIHRDLTAAVLEGLEKSLRSRTKDFWAPSFCAILVLCLCMEKLQTAADTMVVFDMQKFGAKSEWTRDVSHEACYMLDEFPFGMCTRLFHEIYRTRKQSNGGARAGGFNPLRSVGEGTSTKLDQADDAMVREMYNLICNSFIEILDLADRPPLVMFGEMADPQAIKDNGNGRLAAKFLKSFFWDD